MSVSLRPFRPQDIDEVVAIEDLCFLGATRYPREVLIGLFKERPTLIAESAGAVVGFIIAGFKDLDGASQGYIETLDVHPDPCAISNHLSYQCRGLKWR
jgi:hypothetical protein